MADEWVIILLIIGGIVAYTVFFLRERARRARVPRPYHPPIDKRPPLDLIYINPLGGHTVTDLETQVCCICQLPLGEGAEELAQCPHCGALGHRSHFTDWVHLRKKCPICRKGLKAD